MATSGHPTKELIAAMRARLVEVDGDFVVRFHNADGQLVVGRPLAEQVAAELAPRLCEALRSTLDDGQPRRVAHADGAATWVTRVDGVEPSLCVASYPRDLYAATTRPGLEDALDASRMGLWSWNVRTDEVQWNDHMRELTGHDEPVHPRRWAERLAHPDDRAEVERGMAASAGERVVLPAFRILRADGEIRWVIASNRLIADDEGRPSLMVGSTQDVTAQRRLEDKLRNAERLEAMGHLTAGVAHNFNNMLMVIIACLDELGDAVQGPLAMDVADARDASRRAKDIVRELMSFAGQQGQLEREPVNAKELCDTSARLFRRALPDGISFELQLDTQLDVEVAPGAIEQVLGNVLVNARDALQIEGTQAPAIELRARDLRHFGEPWVEITVADNGPGIPEELRSKIFEPFVTTKFGSGTGLGLATSQAIVLRHGGQLACRPSTAGGAEFLLLLPGATSKVARVVDGPPAAPAEPRRVLLVDDEPAIRRLIATGLEATGFTATAVGTLEEVDALLAAGAAFDVCLLDRSLGPSRGLAIVPALRDKLPQMRILFFTGEWVTPEELALVDGVVQKPLSLDELVATLGAAWPA